MLALLRVLGRLGVQVWCHNWMPVVSWSRTSVTLPGRGGAEVTGFDRDNAGTNVGYLEEDDDEDRGRRGVAGRRACCRPSGQMRKDVREFIRRLEAVGLTVESTPGHYHVFRDGKPLRKANGMPFTLPFSPDTTRWRKTAILDLRKLGIDV